MNFVNLAIIPTIFLICCHFIIYNKILNNVIKKHKQENMKMVHENEEKDLSKK